jgi:hypothetical protein
MFVIDKSDTFKWPVSYSVPVDGGKYETHKIIVVFKRLSQKRITEMGKPDVQDVAFAKEVVAGWEGIETSDKNEFEFSDENLDKLLDKPLMAAAIVLAYTDAVMGGMKRKN